MVFRNKHAAHRSMDAPRDESEDSKIAHARAVSSIMGLLFSPRPSVNAAKLDSLFKNPMNEEDFRRELWKSNYLTYQTCDDTKKQAINFSVEVEHPAIVAEAYAIIKRLVA
jgi:hypothetical protein